MKMKAAVALALTATLSACATVYSTSREWKLPAGMGDYVLSAKMDVGFLIRQVTISVNGRELLSGQSYLWSDIISMEGAIDQFPIVAICKQSAKSCDVSIAGIHAADLSF